MIRRFRIHFSFLQNFCVHLQPLARSAAHSQLRVLRGLKHGTAYDHMNIGKIKSSVSTKQCDLSYYFFSVTVIATVNKNISVTVTVKVNETFPLQLQLTDLIYFS